MKLTLGVLRQILASDDFDEIVIERGGRTYECNLTRDGDYAVMSCGDEMWMGRQPDRKYVVLQFEEGGDDATN
jgi:hypothetical protein